VNLHARRRVDLQGELTLATGPDRDQRIRAPMRAPIHERTRLILAEIAPAHGLPAGGILATTRNLEHRETIPRQGR
jgi:hypothetical protein